MTTQDEGFDSLDAILMEPTSPVGTLSDALAFANEWDVAFVEDWDVEPLSLGFTMFSDSDEVQTPQAAETPPTDTGASISREPVYKTLAPRMSVEGLKMGRPAPVDPSTIKRMTRREEIVYLRSAAVELENQLAQLQEEECEPSSNVWSLWQDVASRQREFNTIDVVKRENKQANSIELVRE
ncbi:hypothetical protein Poli38472_004882 [Pythium oligandrum]|uniref:Uncharacterized protein n=1 Tax=Pythium oligandrum TaxID=41045 RepID=A0A8K1CBW0_PYTOL|nr:hypothetical protein Poli38472_004882 [Pythium oligandrum]|eukprot:TMW59813.1 hypothetical protein Poli38472_004882 [Pythium oligandrum]